jgi:hypothetical protein
VSGVGSSVDRLSDSTDDLVRSIRSAMQVANPAPVARNATVIARVNPLLPTAIAPVVRQAKTAKRVGSKRYTLALLLGTIAGIASIWFGNQAYAPEMYGTDGMVPAAEAHAKNLNYAVFDLNLNIRALREEQLKRMTKTPDVIILGASHWQEAHKDLLKGQDFFNAHIHRDYWEDPLGMVELLVRYNRLPKKLIISIRDNQFKPVETRKDFLWEPGIPAYRAMADRLGLEKESYLKTLPYNRGRALISLPMLFENITRWTKATERPGPSVAKNLETLDTLLPDGSIVWSAKHMDVFTKERTLAESNAFAMKRKDDPPQIDPDGVEAFETLLQFLKAKGVSVYLVNPPFNPLFYDQVQGTPYAEGLQRMEALVQRIATDHQLPLFGGFNPHKLGCTADMFIDAEHSNQHCLQKVFDEFTAIDALRGTK